MGRYWELRRETPTDRGIQIPESCDWVLARHLRALDDEYGRYQREQHENLAAEARAPAAPPTRAPIRRH